jgi:hypothetical protein
MRLTDDEGICPVSCALMYPNQEVPRRMRLAGHVARTGDMKNTHFWLENLKRPFRRPRHRWEDNIRMDLRETGWEGVDWMGLAQDSGQWRAFVNTVMNLQVPHNVRTLTT